MAFKVIVLSLLLAYVSYTQGAAIPSQLINQVQDFLVNPEPLASAMGISVKTSTGDWDKEIDIEALGLSFKLKYFDAAHPIKGGHVLMKLTNKFLVKTASIDNVELEFDFKGGEAVDGLFEMKIDYKFIQKFTFFADRLQQGTITLYRRFENGMYKTTMRLDTNTKKVVEMYLETNHIDFLVGKVTLGHDNTWDMTVTMVPRKSITITFLQNGVGYTLVGIFDKTTLTANVKLTIPGKTFHLDLALNPAGKYGFHVTGDIYGPLGVLMVLKKDLTGAEINIKHRDNVYALVKLVGAATLAGVIPTKFKYETTYTFMHGPAFTMAKLEGQAKIHFDVLAPKKVFVVEFIPTGGVQGKVDLTIEILNPGLTYVFEITHGGESYLKTEGTHAVTANDATKLEATDISKTHMSPKSVFYKLHCNYMTYPLPCATDFTYTQKYHYDKQNVIIGFKNYFLHKFAYESESTLGGTKFSHFKVDTTKTPFTYMLEVPQAPYYYPFEGKVDLTFTPKENFGHNFIFKFTKNGQMITQVVHDHQITNDATKFEIVQDTKITMTEEFYTLNRWYKNMLYPVAQYKDGHQIRKFFFDKVNKNFLMNKMSFEDVVMLDGKLTHEYKLNTINTPYVLTIHQVVAPQWYPIEGRFDLAFEPRDNFGFHMIYNFVHGGKTHLHGDHDITVVTDANKLEVTEVSKQTVPEHSLLHTMTCKLAYPLPCPTQIDVVRKVFVDKMNKNFFLNKMTLDTEVKLDGHVYRTIKLDTVKTPHELTWTEPKSPFWMPSPMTLYGLPMMTVTVDHKAGKEHIIKTNLADMKLTIKTQPKIFIEFIKHQETHLLLDAEVNANVITADLKTMLYMPTGSIFCPTGSTSAECYHKYEAEFKAHVDRKSKIVFLNKFSIIADIKKNNVHMIETEINTMLTPCVIKVKAPTVLPMIFHDPRRHTLDVTVEYKEGEMLHIITNAPEMSSLKISYNGVQGVIELNGGKLLIANYKQGDRHFHQVIILPTGEQIIVNLVWTTWNIKLNKVSMLIETPTTKFNVNTDYDIDAGKMMVKFHGEHPLLGKFEIMRNGNLKVTANQIIAKWTGKDAFTKTPLAMLSPIDTVSTVNYNIAKKVLNADYVKTVAGKKWGLNVLQNKITLYIGQPI